MTKDFVSTLRHRQYFPASFAEGHHWFERLCKENGADYRKYPKPGAFGPNGEQLAISVGWFGRRDASKVYLAISGTHGQEYFCGAAGQFQWIANGGPKELPEGVAVCLIHSANPFGAAYGTRTTDTFVDLNRNFRDSDSPRPPGQLFEEIAQAISLKAPTDQAIYDVIEAFSSLMSKYPPAEVMTAIAGGQDRYHHDMAYCGSEQVWETKTLFSIVKEFLGGTKTTALIDWHTGLGKFGEATLLLEFAEESQPGKLGRKWWGEPALTSSIYDDGVEPDIEGQLCDGLAEFIARSGATVVQTVIEIGTFDNRAMIGAFVMDRWLRVEASDLTSLEAVRLHTKMMERYNPSLPEWREKALSEMTKVYTSTLAGLAEA